MVEIPPTDFSLHNVPNNTPKPINKKATGIFPKILSINEKLKVKENLKYGKNK